MGSNIYHVDITDPSTIHFNMEALPPYHASPPTQESLSVSASARAGVNSTATSPAVNPISLPAIDPLGVIGGSGVRIPLSPDERVRYDRRICAQLRSWGTYSRANSSIPANSPLRYAHSCISLNPLLRTLHVARKRFAQKISTNLLPPS